MGRATGGTAPLPRLASSATNWLRDEHGAACGGPVPPTVSRPTNSDSPSAGVAGPAPGALTVTGLAPGALNVPRTVPCGLILSREIGLWCRLRRA